MQYLDLYELEELRKEQAQLAYWRERLEYWMHRANGGNALCTALANYYAELIHDYMDIPF